MEKFKVIKLLVGTCIEDAVIHYYRMDNPDIRNILLRQYTRNSNVSFDTLRQFYIVWGTEIIASRGAEDQQKKYSETIEQWADRRVSEVSKDLDIDGRYFKVGSCNEGTMIYEVCEMSQDEFENPNGEIDSPYREFDDPLSKYPFSHPITDEILRP